MVAFLNKRTAIWKYGNLDAVKKHTYDEQNKQYYICAVYLNDICEYQFIHTQIN